MLSELTTLQFQHPLTDPLNLSINIKRTHPTAVIINVIVDGFLIIPLYQNLAVPPTDYIDFNDKWSLDIPNFYQWYHEITGQGWII